MSNHAFTVGWTCLTVSHITIAILSLFDMVCNGRTDMLIGVLAFGLVGGFAIGMAKSYASDQDGALGE